MAKLIKKFLKFVLIYFFSLIITEVICGPIIGAYLRVLPVFSFLSPYFRFFRYKEPFEETLYAIAYSPFVVFVILILLPLLITFLIYSFLSRRNLSKK